MKKSFQTTQSDLRKYNGTDVKVGAELTDEERDPEVGRMWHIEFEDGKETDVFQDELFLCREKFDAVKAKLTQMMADGWEIPKLVACVYDLFQDYIISERQEIELYSFVDKDECYNDVGSYWRNMDYENPLLQVIE